jgi:hypothetical protein
MCGLVASFNTSPDKKKKAQDANQFIIDQFEDQHSRGVKGFGIIRIGKNMNVEIDRACETTKFLVDLYFKKSPIIIAHHRTPTSTNNLIDQTHPMFISNDILKYDYNVVHNGIVSNDTELYKKHEELGFLYKTEYLEVYSDAYEKTKFNDSECIAVELALFIEGKITNIDITNNAAFIVLQSDKKTKKAVRVFFGKNNTGDLNMDRRDNELRISSEGLGEKVDPNILFSFDPKDPTITLMQTPIPFKAQKVYESTGVRSDGYEGSGWKMGRIWDAETHKYVDPPATQPALLPTNVEVTKVDKTKDMIPVAGKGYVSEACIEFKKTIELMDTTELSHAIDDALDEQTERAEEILTEYKSYLLIEKTDKDVEAFYINQMEEVLKAMRAMSNIAYKDYGEKEMTEAEEAEDVKAYNASFGVPEEKEKPRTHTNWNHIHRPMAYHQKDLNEMGF